MYAQPCLWPSWSEQSCGKILKPNHRQHTSWLVSGSYKEKKQVRLFSTFAPCRLVKQKPFGGLRWTNSEYELGKLRRGCCFLCILCCYFLKAIYLGKRKRGRDREHTAIICSTSQKPTRVGTVSGPKPGARSEHDNPGGPCGCEEHLVPTPQSPRASACRKLGSETEPGIELRPSNVRCGDLHSRSWCNCVVKGNG